MSQEQSKPTRKRVGVIKQWKLFSQSERNKIAKVFGLTVNQLYNAMCYEYRADVIAFLEEKYRVTIYRQTWFKDKLRKI